MISVSQADEQSTFFRYWIFTYIKKQEELEMKSYEEMTKEELLKEKEGLEAEYKKFQRQAIPGTVRPFDGNDGCTDFRC